MTMHENEINTLEAQIEEMTKAHASMVTQMNGTIQYKDSVIAHQTMLLEKYRMVLLPSGVKINHDNGKVILGSIGKRGFEESWEEERVQNLKRRKMALQEDVDKLTAMKNNLDRAADSKGMGKDLEQGDGLASESYHQSERLDFKGKGKAESQGDVNGHSFVHSEQLDEDTIVVQA